ncbi:MAG: AMP-binding protein [Bacteroidaceae bacterium]
MEESFIKNLEKSIKQNWDLDALTDYKGATLQYKDLARKIEKLHILFEASNIKRGDKIALCGRNCAHWGVAFLGILTYGAVAVPILHEFKSDNIHHLVNHSEARLLFVGDGTWENLNESAMPYLDGILGFDDFELVLSRSEKLAYARAHLNELYGKKYPSRFYSDSFTWVKDEPEQLAIINYTSGTTSQSKGVMLPYRALWSNTDFAIDVLGDKPGRNVVSMLPMAHMYGLAFEFLYEICTGMHVFFLTRIPSPKIIFQAFAEVKPDIIIAVPLIIEKIIKKNILPKLQTPTMKILMRVPIVNDHIREQIREKMLDGFGGRVVEVVVGGAAFNQEVEQFLRSINFPYTVGYGMTECGPIIGYEGWHDFVSGSCGKAAPRMEIKINNPDPVTQVGEIICKGANMMLGYYRNQEATHAAIDSDGWLHTGDLGLLDEKGNIFIKGRSKNMLLSSNGQNIYPEEIEDKLNALPFVAESVIVQREDRLVALIYPDIEEAAAQGLSQNDVEEKMENNRLSINQEMPSYQQITKVQLMPEEFEKTPKKSIKRFLYN